MQNSRTSTVTMTSTSSGSSASSRAFVRPTPSITARCTQFIIRGLPLVALVTPIYYALSWLQQPGVAYGFVLFLDCLFMVSTVRSYREGDTIFRITLGPSVLLTAAVLMQALDMVSYSFFVFVIGFFGVLFSVFLSLVSNYIGRARFPIFSYVLTSVSLSTPLLLGTIALTLPHPSGAQLYALGIMSSVIASGINVFFNKSPASVGFASL